MNYTDSKLEFLCETRKKVRTKNRSSVITEKMIGSIVSLYNGKRYTPIAIVKKMLGHKLGEFVFTKSLGKSIHSSVKNKKKKKK
ncbi:30S ribosomal protein S19 [bacterium]|nr:MAG: 30S ribosomal protein S19 [bacterium]